MPGDPWSCESNQPTSLIKAIARARSWYERIISGEIHNLEQIALCTGVTPRYVSRILRCEMISPRQVEGILSRG
jgi:site-specific DNA recombinase